MKLGAWISCLVGMVGQKKFLWPSFGVLVFWICDIGDLPVPAASTVQALVALVFGRAGLCLRAYSAGPRPPGRVFTVDHMT